MAKKEDKISMYTKELEAQGVPAQLAEKLAAEKAANEVALEQAAEENSKLQEKLEATETSAKVNAPVITHKGTKYKVTIPSFKLGDEKFTVADLKDNSELVEKLIKMQFGGLVKLEGK